MKRVICILFILLMMTGFLGCEKRFDKIDKQIYDTQEQIDDLKDDIDNYKP